MEQRIIHVCGHEQAHYLTGYISQQERKANWLRTTKCRSCFAAEKQEERASALARDQAAVAHLDLPQLCGSDRQVAWATTIRASRLAAIGVDQLAPVSTDVSACIMVIDAKWWIDHRSLNDPDLLASVPSELSTPLPHAENASPSSMPHAA